jgi:beta-lactam-binding protein with PASTA domain
VIKAVVLSVSVTATWVVTAIFGSDVADAASQPDVVGQKYSDAASQLSAAGLSVVVSTTVGDSVTRPNCLVTRQEGRSEAPPENTSASPVSQVVISLNCGAPVASATSSGNSVASPEGRAAAAAASATPAPTG